MKIEFDGFEIDCEVQYGKRKRITVSLDTTGSVTIKAPNNTPEETIINSVRPLGDKIKAKLEDLKAIRSTLGEKTYDDNGSFFYLGKEYALQDLIDIGGLTEEEMKDRLKKHYIQSLKRIIPERIKIYENELGLKAKVIDINESKSQWGSCSSDKKVAFNYRLAMAPMEAIDYVVVHELCHLKHMNHDRSFWRLVGSILPDYKTRKEYLNKYGQFLTL
ncbi:M48 family metallopeptidase [Tissierella creatinini]|nr:M48 family metallopeptidase [Tissierella creatinini]TJX66493.1 M48 family metallopeptidase [Soehngenia saccharolytica]